MKRISILIFAIITLLFLNACETIDYDNTIYVTIYPIEYITKAIVGDNYDVITIYPEGADAHHYEPPMSDLVNIAKSKFLFYIGAGLELFIEEVEDSTFNDENVQLFELSLGFELYEWGADNLYEYDEHDDDHFHNLDPHIWLDPNNMIIMGNKILQEVITDKPELEDEFLDNFANFESNMLDLDTRFENILENSNLDTIIVDHDAYVYWTLRYGINRIRIRTNAEGSDTSIQIMIEIRDQALELGIDKILMTKNVGDSETALGILDAIDGTKLYLHNLSSVTSEEREQGLDYYSLMLENISVLEEALE